MQESERMRSLGAAHAAELAEMRSDLSLIHFPPTLRCFSLILDVYAVVLTSDCWARERHAAELAEMRAAADAAEAGR